MSSQRSSEESAGRARNAIMYAVLLFSSTNAIGVWNSYYTLKTAAQARKEQIEELRQELKAEIARRAEDRWTGSDTNRWLKEFRELNPELNVPKGKP